MEYSVHNWLNDILDLSALQWEDIKNRKLDDTFGWGAIFAASMEANPDVSGRGLLLTGPQGCGKHNAAAHMMKLLYTEGYDSVFLDGMELDSLGLQQAKECLDMLLDHFYDQQKGLCICLDEMAACSCRRQLLTCLGQTLYKYRMYRKELNPIYLILIDEQEDIPNILRQSLRLCRMSYPDLARRETFLTSKAKLLRNSVSLHTFAKATEGASYAQLLDMIANVEGLVDSQGNGLADEGLIAFLSNQMPPVTGEESLKKLPELLNKLVEQLPNLASASVVGTVSSQPANQIAAPVNSDQYARDKRKEFEEMKVGDLAADLFGTEGVNEILETHELRQ